MKNINFPVNRSGLTLHLVGLGDVGGTLLTGLVLLGNMFETIGIYDPDEKRVSRYEQEMNQVLPVNGSKARVAALEKENLFDHCDVFAFTASAGVPPLGSGVSDVRMAQFAKNRSILEPYVETALRKGYSGLFMQISDPVDRLCQTAADAGFPREKIIGCGLGVMLGRADYYARLHGQTDFLVHGRVYGPHGEGLVAANDRGAAYDDVYSRQLTREVVSANLKVRETGFKPYIAPGLSSACLTILKAVRGEWFDGAVFQDGLFFGRRARLTENDVQCEDLPSNPQLFARIRESMQIERTWKNS